MGSPEGVGVPAGVRPGTAGMGGVRAPGRVSLLRHATKPLWLSALFLACLWRAERFRTGRHVAVTA